MTVPRLITGDSGNIKLLLYHFQLIMELGQLNEKVLFQLHLIWIKIQVENSPSLEPLPPTGMVEPIRFIWLVSTFSLSTALAASILIFIEQLKSDTEVQEIQIMPSVIKLSQHSFSTVAQSQFPDTPDGKHDGGSWSRLSKLSTYTQKLDPTLSFVSSMN